MKNRDYSTIKYLMNKDSSLEQEIYNLQCELKRDLTVEEEEVIVYDMVNECKKRSGELSCSLVEAYNDIMS